MGDYWFQKPRFTRKRPAIAMRTYVLWFIFGGMGMHRFYLGLWRSGLVYVVYIILTAFIEIGIVENMDSISWETKDNISLGVSGFLFLMLFIDLFLIRGLVDRANERFSAVEVFN